MPAFLIGFLYFFFPDPILLRGVGLRPFLFLLGIIFIYTAVFPALLVYYLYSKKMVSDLHLSRLQDRRWPYLITVLLYAGLFFFLYRQGGILIPSSMLLLGMAIVISLVGLISLFWQISAHMAGMGGVLGTIAILLLKYGENSLFLPLLFLCLLSGFLASARLKMNAHTLWQTGAGFLLGMAVSMAGTWLFI